MILAREIAEGLIAIDYVVDTTSNGPWVVRYGAFELGSRFATKADAESACSQHRNRLTSLIAAKLEPVKRMVLDLVRVGNDMAAIPTPHPEIEISEARAMIMTPQAQWAELCKHDSTLALLSDEETKP